MARDDAHPNYLAIFGALTILTALEIGVVYLPVAHWVIVFFLCTFALMKAGLVAAYFMHLKFEPIRLIAMVLFPIVLILAMVGATIPDALWRPPSTPAIEQPDGSTLPGEPG